MKIRSLYPKIVAIGIVLSVIAGCTASQVPPAAPTATATPDLGPERTATAKVLEEATLQASQTTVARETENAQATVAQKTQVLIDRQATSTQAKIYQMTATAESVMQATARAQPMYALVQNLYEEGVISTDQGTYIQASDFDESWAQLNYYDFWLVEEAVLVNTSHFVVSANIAWESASDNANWDCSGCGFVLYDTETDRHYFVFLSMDGYASLLYNDGGRSANYKAKKPTNSKGIPEGEAEFVMAIQDQTITVYVNGVKALSYTEPLYKPGVLLYSLVSGTNKGYGTHCKMTNIGLWALETEE